MAAAEEYKAERDGLAEQMNQISELLLGYREGNFGDIMMRATHYKFKSQNVELNSKCRTIADEVNALKELVDSIIDDA